MILVIDLFLSLEMSKIFSINPQTGNNYSGDEQTVTNVINVNPFSYKTLRIEDLF